MGNTCASCAKDEPKDARLIHKLQQKKQLEGEQPFREQAAMSRSVRRMERAAAFETMYCPDESLGASANHLAFLSPDESAKSGCGGVDDCASSLQASSPNAMSTRSGGTATTTNTANQQLQYGSPLGPIIDVVSENDVASGGTGFSGSPQHRSASDVLSAGGTWHTKRSVSEERMYQLQRQQSMSKGSSMSSAARGRNKSPRPNGVVNDNGSSNSSGQFSRNSSLRQQHPHFLSSSGVSISSPTTQQEPSFGLTHDGSQVLTSNPSHRSSQTTLLTTVSGTTNNNTNGANGDVANQASSVNLTLPSVLMGYNSLRSSGDNFSDDSRNMVTSQGDGGGCSGSNPPTSGVMSPTARHENPPKSPNKKLPTSPSNRSSGKSNTHGHHNFKSVASSPSHEADLLEQKQKQLSRTASSVISDVNSSNASGYASPQDARSDEGSRLSASNVMGTTTGGAAAGKGGTPQNQRSRTNSSTVDEESKSTSRLSFQMPHVLAQQELEKDIEECKKNYVSFVVVDPEEMERIEKIGAGSSQQSYTQMMREAKGTPSSASPLPLVLPPAVTVVTSPLGGPTTQGGTPAMGNSMTGGNTSFVGGNSSVPMYALGGSVTGPPPAVHLRLHHNNHQVPQQQQQHLPGQPVSFNASTTTAPEDVQELQMSLSNTMAISSTSMPTGHQRYNHHTMMQLGSSTTTTTNVPSITQTPMVAGMSLSQSLGSMGVSPKLQGILVSSAKYSSISAPSPPQLNPGLPRPPREHSTVSVASSDPSSSWASSQPYMSHGSSVPSPTHQHQQQKVLPRGGSGELDSFNNSMTTGPPLTDSFVTPHLRPQQHRVGGGSSGSHLATSSFAEHPLSPTQVLPPPQLSPTIPIDHNGTGAPPMSGRRPGLPAPSSFSTAMSPTQQTYVLELHQSPEPMGMLHYDRNEGKNSHKSYQAVAFKEKVQKMTLMEAQAFQERREEQRLKHLRAKRLYEIEHERMMRSEQRLERERSINSSFMENSEIMDEAGEDEVVSFEAENRKTSKSKRTGSGGGGGGELSLPSLSRDGSSDWIAEGDYDSLHPRSPSAARAKNAAPPVPFFPPVPNQSSTPLVDSPRYRAKKKTPSISSNDSGGSGRVIDDDDDDVGGPSTPLSKDELLRNPAAKYIAEEDDAFALSD